MEKIKVLFRKPMNQPLQIREMENSCEGIYDLLQCELFEVIRLDNDVLCLLDEEGKLTGKECNFFDSRYGWIVGNVAFCGSDGEEFASLTDDQMDYVVEYIGFPIK